MKESCPTRARLFKQHRRLVYALNALLENQVITAESYQSFKAQIDQMYDGWKKERRLNRPPSGRPPGRPKSCKDDLDPLPVCKAYGCGKLAAPRQAYCSPECAPYAFFSDEPAARASL